LFCEYKKHSKENTTTIICDILNHSHGNVTGKCLQQLYYCTESRPVEKFAILKQPEQIQKEAAAN